MCLSGVQRSELFTNGPCLLSLPGNVWNGPEFEVTVFSIPSHMGKKKDVIIQSAAVFQSAEFPCDLTSRTFFKKGGKKKVMKILLAESILGRTGKSQ